MEAMACGCRLLDRSENANCDTPTQGPSANPIPLSPTIRTTQVFLALFHPSTYLSFTQKPRSIDTISFLPGISFFSTKGYGLRGRSRNVKLGRTT